MKLWVDKIALPHVRIRNLALSCQGSEGVELIYRKDSSRFIFRKRKSNAKERVTGPGKMKPRCSCL